MTLDEILTRVDGSIDLIRGRRDTGWRKLDLSADGFLNSFLAIPVCLPALLVLWLAHASWLSEAGGEWTMGYAVGALAVIELVVWFLTIALFLVLAGPMQWRDRLVPTIIAVNWGSVLFAYIRAVPAVLALVVGLGDFISFITLIVALLTLVGYARLLAASLERSVATVAGVFVASVALGILLANVGHSVFGLIAQEPAIG